MVQGGLTCKECGGKEICTLSWCWQHKCGVGKIKIILCLSCPNVSDWLRGLSPSSSGFIDRLQKAILKLTVTIFWPTKFDGQRSVIGAISPVGITCTQIDMLGCFWFWFVAGLFCYTYSTLQDRLYSRFSSSREHQSFMILI